MATSAALASSSGARYATDVGYDVANTPLPLLLTQGGDDRLAVDPATGLNVYGCAPSPRDGVPAFSSSTASSISHGAFRRAKVARLSLVQDLSRLPLREAFEHRIEAARRALKAQLQLDRADVVFSASGTDSQLHAHALVRMTLGEPLTTIVVASDQTGSGTAHTSRARHFSSVTALGRMVTKGGLLDENDDASASIGIALTDDNGHPRSAAVIDADVLKAVGAEIAAGRKVLLQTMESSKLGWRAPSDDCIETIRRQWPRHVQIVVDACQLRIDRARIKACLDKGMIVLVTGSKFFMGPGFSGAAIVPCALSERCADLDHVPHGLADYLTRYDVPAQWIGLRQVLPDSINVGQWLRWEAALEEMACYYALPAGFAAAVFGRLGAALADIMNATQSLEPDLADGGCPLPGGDDEFSLRTVFPFRVKGPDGYLAHEDMVKLYRSLNGDLSRSLPPSANAADRLLAAQPFHIGQPVRLGTRSVLRMALGARTATEAWSANAADGEAAIGHAIAQLGAIASKIDLLVQHGLAGR